MTRTVILNSVSYVITILISSFRLVKFIIYKAQYYYTLINDEK